MTATWSEEVSCTVVVPETGEPEAGEVMETAAGRVSVLLGIGLFGLWTEVLPQYI